MMDRYFDKDGSPLTALEWSKKLESIEYKRIAATDLPNGKLVSTVWLGLNHNFIDGPPLIFETMVFPAKGEADKRDWGELDCEHYSTLAEAEAGHKAMVTKWSQEEQEAI